MRDDLQQGADAVIVIPAEPGEFSFPADRIALVVIDMQRDFCEPEGFGATLGNDVSLLRPIIPAIAEVLGAFRRLGLPVIHTREGHLADLSDCPPAKRLRGSPGLRIGDRGPMGRILIRGEPGNQIVPELAPVAGEVVIDKPGKGAFYATSLEVELKRLGVTHLAFAGVTTEVCVQTTMREANDRGYECVLLEDCTESYFPQFKQSAVEMIRAQGGIVGWTTGSRHLIRGLSGGRR
jgi:nicotinamidase-related amidase